MYAKLTADQSAAVLSAKLRSQQPFFFLRYGDGALECMAGMAGRTCDGEFYTGELAAELRHGWESLAPAPQACIGDWLTASFNQKTEPTRYADQYRALVGRANPTWLHFETLLLMRDSEALLDFYRAVRRDRRRKLFMGAPWNAAAAEMLEAEFLSTPETDLFRHVERLSAELLARDFDVLLYGAGLAGNIPALRCWEKYPERTYVNLGSAMDPLFRGRPTRMQQLPQSRARALFEEMLP